MTQTGIELDSPRGTPAEAGDPTRDLVAVLAAQALVYGQLRQLAGERHAALVAADVERLGDLVGREQPLLSRVRRLEAARLSLLRPWADRLGVAPEQVALGTLLPLVEAPAAAELAAARDRLLEVVDALSEANRRNAVLLEACLGSVNESVRHLLQTIQLDPRYASDGHRTGQEALPRLTDYRA